MYDYKYFRLFESLDLRNGSTCTKDLGTFSKDLIDIIVERGKVIFLFNGQSSAGQYEAGSCFFHRKL